MNSSLLKINNLRKSFSEYFSLKDINIELNKGEVHGIVGENGSGKSSLMKIISGIYKKDSGDIYLEGNLVNVASPSDGKKLGIRIIHQESSLFEHISIAENVFIDNAPYIHKNLKLVNFSRMYKECDSLLKELGLAINSKTIVKFLSPAQKQIVEIAKAYASKAKIIIMDEPTAALGESETLMLFDKIKSSKKEGVSLFYITHKLEEISQICDRVSVLRDGKIIYSQDINHADMDNIFHMISNYNLKERYPKITFKLGPEVLGVRNLTSKGFFENINISLRKREILGIAGLIGSGGTKIAESIFGISNNDSGEIVINGVNCRIKSPSDAIKAKIAYVTEDRIGKGIFPRLKVYENLSAASISRITHKYFINKRYEQELAASYMDKLGLESYAINDKMSHLSGGNQQKVVLAKWIMSKSKIFIFDEPTKGIDIASKVDVYNLMNELLQKGASIILISSDLNELMGMCDRITILSKGKIIDTIPRQLFTAEKIIKLEVKE